MVFGNLSTGYWLGGASAFGSFRHWVELSRKTLTSPSDTIDVDGGVGKGFDSDDIAQNNISGGFFNFNMLRDNSTDGCHWDLSNDTPHSDNQTSSGVVSDTQWVLRAKIKFTAIGSSGSGNYMWLGLSKNYNSFTSNDTIDKTIMCQFAMDSSNSYHTNDTNASSSLASNQGTGDNSQTWTPSTDTDYYLDIRRTSATAYSVSIYTGDDFSTGNVGTITGTCDSGLDDLRYIKVLNQYSTGALRAFTGKITWFKFYNGTNTTTGTPTKTYDFSGLTPTPYLMIIPHVYSDGGSQIYGQGRFNGDTGGNYHNRWSTNGGSDTYDTSQTVMRTYFNGSTQQGEFGVGKVFNVTNKEKLLIMNGAAAGGSSGAGNAPARREIVSKWANATDSISSFQYVNGGAGTFDTGSEVVILGYDPNVENESGTDVWEELKSVSITSASSIDTGTITAKKYLWIQFTGVGSNASSYPRLRFNSDTGTNFCYRQAADGGTDNTQTSQNHINTTGNVGAFTHYFNAFVINKATKEKFVSIEGVDSNTAGAGNAPRRREVAGKWTNTSDQITSVQVLDLAAHNFSSATLNVWGFD